MTRTKKILTALCSLGLTLLYSGTELPGQTVSNYAQNALQNLQRQNSTAQYSLKAVQNQNLNRSIGTTGVLGVNRRMYGLTSSAAPQRKKPFTGLQSSPTVSPYLALSNPFATATDYYNIVRPQQEQRRINQQMARQQYMQEKQLNQLAAQGPYAVTGNDEMAPTGHAAGYMQFGAYFETGDFFPAPTRPQSQRQ